MGVSSPIPTRGPRELYRVSALSVAASTLGLVIDLNPLKNPFITVLARANVAHSWTVTVSPGTNGLTLPMGTTAPSWAITDLHTDGGGLRIATDWIEALSDRMTVYINNQDSGGAHTYDVLVYGIG